MALRKVVYLDASLSFLWQSAPMLVALACFTAFIFADPGCTRQKWLTFDKLQTLENQDRRFYYKFA